MTAQFWLWVVLSGLGGGLVGWWARGRKISGRELRIEREWNDRLATVEEHSKRCLAQAREEAAEAWHSLTAERDGLRSRLAELEEPGRRESRANGRTTVPAAKGETAAAATRAREKGNGGRPPLPAEARPARAAAIRPSRPRSANGGGRPDDDLRKIRGIGPAYERALREMGYETYHDIASWGASDREAVAARLGGKARPEAWVAEAARLDRGMRGAEA